jgi:hypothetical protein
MKGILNLLQEAFNVLKTQAKLWVITLSTTIFLLSVSSILGFPNVGRVLDTLVLSRVCHPDILTTDKKRKWKQMPPQLYGRHSLESYGYRLGEYKGEFGKDSDWKEWSQEMQDYCLQDVHVTAKLWNHFQPFLNGSR